MTSDLRQCSTCKEIRPLTDFYLDKRRQKYHAQCRPCKAKRFSEWSKQPEIRAARNQKKRERNKANPDKVRSQNYKNKYCISLNDYKRMLEAQAGKCLICECPPTAENNGQKLYVDHSHTTRRVRGLLCHHCNFLIGMARENITILEKAIGYLKAHNCL